VDARDGHRSRVHPQSRNRQGWNRSLRAKQARTPEVATVHLSQRRRSASSRSRLRRAGCCTCGRARQGTRAGGRRGDRDNDRVARETRLTVEQLGQLAEVADRQAARFAAAADVIGAELGEERAGPSYPGQGRPRWRLSIAGSRRPAASYANCSATNATPRARRDLCGVRFVLGPGRAHASVLAPVSRQ
jgi:hypothetical protein